MRPTRWFAGLLAAVILLAVVPGATARKAVRGRVKPERVATVSRGYMEWMAASRNQVCWVPLALRVDCYDKAQRKKYTADYGDWTFNSVVTMDEEAIFWDGSHHLLTISTKAERPADYRTATRSVSLYEFAEGNILTGITLDADYVYIMVEGPPNKLVRVPRKGGEAKELVTSRSMLAGFHLANDATHVYWLGQIDPYIRRVPKEGGPAEEFFRVGAPRAIAVDDKEVCVVRDSPPEVACIDKQTRERRVVTRLAPSLRFLSAVVMDGDMLYFADEGMVDEEANIDRPASDPAIRVRDGAIYKVPRAGGKPVVVAKGLDEPIDLHVDATDVYWMSRRAGGIWRIAK